MTNQNYKLHGIFPIPVYETYRESELDSTDENNNSNELTLFK